jgi:curved DNA-binding protein CbpA
MQIKTAFETLNNPERRKLYDIYGQTDFKHDDTMKNMMEVRFKNETEREIQWNAYVSMKTNMKVFSEVMPYYLTWLLLTIYRVDRQASFNILIGLIAVICIFEI